MIINLCLDTGLIIMVTFDNFESIHLKTYKVISERDFSIVMKLNTAVEKLKVCFIWKINYHNWIYILTKKINENIT